ncbi:m-AAA protease-interacting protein 1, mitochondrial [Kryptolebias marmoratus]|uniref:Matrix AAA peptidase interacting protein 1 n=1 Tax=Kryptolebias marmoratus TaxID=37003 RepID=A0A3Q3ACJ1_KRYMA|nr:m-AAA protease-interacting protein 1, mitochondrial [Kryptolebias marmoratus]
MALPLFRCCSRLNSAFNCTRLVLNQNVAPNWFCKPRLRASVTAARFCSSERKHKVVVFGFTNPILWLRSRINYIRIIVNIDKDFSMKEFVEGSTQAFCRVSGLLSRCQFEELDGLVDEDLIKELEKKCRSLPSSFQKALNAERGDVILSTVRDVQIFVDEGRTFVCILMHFWYMTSVLLPEGMEIPGTRLFKVALENDEIKTLLGAVYEFEREFTEEAPSSWTITRVDYPKVLD